MNSLLLLALFVVGGQCVWFPPPQPLTQGYNNDPGEMPWFRDHMRSTTDEAGEEGVTYKDIEVGSGPQVLENGDILNIMFKAFKDELDGRSGRIKTSHMYSQATKDSSYQLTLGSTRSIKGLSEACRGMREGGKRKAHIPSRAAFGARGSSFFSVQGSTDLVIFLEIPRVIRSSEAEISRKAEAQKVLKQLKDLQDHEKKYHKHDHSSAGKETESLKTESDEKNP